MQIVFTHRDDGPERLLAEAELHFGDDAGPLAGLKLVGFCLWRGADGVARVTVPARAYTSGDERRFFDLVRAQDGSGESVKALKAHILEAHKEAKSSS